jgi:hypothetical protein
MAGVGQGVAAAMPQHVGRSLGHGLLHRLGLGPSRCFRTLAARLNCDIMLLMRSQSVIPRKKRGPPATGKGTPVMVRLQPSLLTRLDLWIEGRGPFSRPEAIRRLLEQALPVAPSIGPVKGGSRRKAAEIAGRTIDQLGDQAATGEERARRKRRLIKGPREFRDVRSDQPKRKG